MRQLRAWALRLVGVLPQDRRERELADELEAHLQLHIDDNIRAGMTPQEARRDALLKLGGVESTKEAYRERGTVLVLDHLLRDVRFAVRQLLKNPGFTATAVLTQALGICATVAIFTFVDAALIKPLPYKDSARLVGVFEHTNQCPQCNLSYPDYLDWKRLNKVFKSLDAYTRSGFIVNTPEGAVPETAVRVTDGFFRTLGVVPVLGRDFYAGEDLAGAPRTVLISYASWRTRYGGRRDIVGQTIVLSGVPSVIIGVLPQDFHFAPAEPAEIWSAFHPETECDLRRSCFGDYGVARLKDGVSVEAALADTALIAHQIEVQYPGSNRGQGANVLPLSDVIVGNVRPVLLMLLIGAGLLLLIATVNVIQPAAGALRRPPPGDCGSGRAGSVAPPADQPVCDRGSGSGGRWRPDRAGAGPLGDATSGAPDSTERSVRRQLPARFGIERARCRVRGDHFSAVRGGVLADAGGPLFFFPDAGRAGRWEPRVRGKYVAASRVQAGGGGAGPCHGAAGLGRSAGPELLSPDARRHGVPAGPSGHPDAFGADHDV